jgi:hypothetical protein
MEKYAYSQVLLKGLLRYANPRPSPHWLLLDVF